MAVLRLLLGHPELADLWNSFLTQNNIDSLPCGIEGLAVSTLYPNEPLTWDGQSCEAAFGGYLLDRYKPGRTNLPLVFEIAVMARIANLHLASGRPEASAIWVERAVLEAAGRPTLQRYLEHCNRYRMGASLKVILGMEAPSESAPSLSVATDESETSQPAGE